MDPGLLTALTALAVAVFGLLGWVARLAWRIARRTSHFLDDYFGEPARNGLAARPGVMARLQGVEDLVTRCITELGKVAAETKPNGGASLHDVMTRTEQAVEQVRAEQETMRTRMEQIERRRTEHGSEDG